MERLRRGLATLAVAALAFALASTLPVAETRARLARLATALTGGPGDRPEAAGFWFDPEFAAFLEDVKRRTPDKATVAVLAPATPDVYRYQACYRLAPRRVVDESRLGEADVVATYRTETARGPGGSAISGGLLWIR